MKRRSPDSRDALSIPHLASALFLIIIIPLVIRAAAPAWWTTRGLFVENASPDDYAPVNQGQLKNIAKAAVAEMDARLNGGAGNELHQMIDTWSLSAPDRNDFAPVTLGQVKNVAKPFYDRLIILGLIDTYPWSRSLDPSDDFAVANIGQVKNLFSFEISLPNIVDDPLQDRLAAGQRCGNLALEPETVWFWGNRFGSDSTFQSMFPRRLTGLANIRSVSAGDDHLVVLTAAGEVLTWGENLFGQLGDGTFSDHQAPSTIPNISNIRAVKAGATHTLALQSDGTVLAWGDNYYGELGIPAGPPSSSPVQVIGLTDVRKIAAGPSRNAALKNDGTVWTWGYDHYAWQTGQDISSAIPLQVPDLTDVVDVAAGTEHFVALKADGTVWTWGSNYSNQLGNGSPTWIFQERPVQVPVLANIRKIASNFDHSLAVAEDGTVWAWGANSFGQLGNGTTQSPQMPVQVFGLTNVIELANTYTYSLAMKADGTVWAWGDGASGMLPNVDLHVPQQIGLGLFDLNHNGMDDRWEMEYFGNLNQSGDADFDGDGISNLKEYLRGTDPRDYYSGITPVIEMASGNNQVGDPGAVLSRPLTVRLRNTSGAVLVNAAVEFKITSGSAALAATTDGSFGERLVTRTDSSGQSSAYVRLAQMPGIVSHITVSPVMPSLVDPKPSVTYRVVHRFVLPPSPTPTPNPTQSPNPTASPSPTARPLLPYRYAIVDLGKGLYPSRINNKGWVLLSGDPDGTWRHYRWKAGVLEPLNYAGPAPTFSVTDMNDDGTVVGSDQALYRRTIGWVNNSLNDIGTGLIWSADSNNAVRFTGPAALTWNPYRSGSIREAYFSAITNPNPTTNQVSIYGGSYEGEGGCSPEDIHLPLEILNARRWGSDLGAPVSLSFSHSTVFAAAETFAAFNWSGPMDRISRANSSGHYIGSRITPFGGGVQGGISSSMVDGQDVNFDPSDINEKDIVVGSNGAGMILRVPGHTDLIFAGSYPIAINGHAHPPVASTVEPSSSTSPQPTPIPAPEILSWVGNALVLWELQPSGNTWHPFGLQEMIPSMDGWDYLVPSDMNDNGLIVGTAWYTDPSNPSASGEQHGFMLVPAEIVPDFNRDGKIDDNDRGRVTESEPWRWWINDDDDKPGDIGGNDDDIPTSSSPDGQQATVQGIRDLIDYFPLHLNIIQLLKTLPPGPQIQYRLKHEQENLRFVYTNLRREAARDYLTKLEGEGLDHAAAFSNAQAIRVTSEGVILDSQWLSKIAGDDEGVLLFEGRGATDKPLLLEVSKDGRPEAELRYFLKIDGVEKMFRHINLIGASNTSAGRATEIGEPANYPDNLCGTKNFVFVHGFNVTPNAARGWNAEVFKRLHQTGSKAKFYGITWDAAESNGTLVPDYHKNVDNAFGAAQAFAQFINLFNGNVTVSAHSLGNILVGSAMHDWGAIVSNYLMIDAAVALESYDSSVEKEPEMVQSSWNDYPPRVWASEWYNNPALSSQDDRRALTWRDRLSSIESNTYNFYSASEDVLRKQEGDPSTWDDLILAQISDHGIYAWAFQEKLKGLERIIGLGPISVKVGSRYGGWQFTHNYFFDPVHAGTPSAAISQTLSDESLTAEPVFDPGFSLSGNPPIKEAKILHAETPEWIIDLTDPSNGSATARAHRNQLLAEMFPARSLPAGANPITKLASANVNMPGLFINDPSLWPNKRTFAGVPEWRHSDIKQIAYSHLYQLFIKWKTIGALDQ